MNDRFTLKWYQKEYLCVQVWEREGLLKKLDWILSICLWFCVHDVTISVTARSRSRSRCGKLFRHFLVANGTLNMNKMKINSFDSLCCFTHDHELWFWAYQNAMAEMMRMLNKYKYAQLISIHWIFRFDFSISINSLTKGSTPVWIWTRWLGRAGGPTQLIDQLFTFDAHYLHGINKKSFSEQINSKSGSTFGFVSIQTDNQCKQNLPKYFVTFAFSSFIAMPFEYVESDSVALESKIYFLIRVAMQPMRCLYSCSLLPLNTRAENNKGTKHSHTHTHQAKRNIHSTRVSYSWWK